MIAKTKQTELDNSSNTNTNKKSSSSINKDSWRCPPNGGSLSLKGITQAVYICQGLSFLFGITAVAGVFINYLKRNEVKDSWLESHFTWQLRTFWFGLGAAVVGFFLTIVIIGFLILAANLVWIIYRVVKGWLLLCEDKPIENSNAFI